MGAPRRLLVALIACLAACGDDAAATGPDASVDAAPDAMVDPSDELFRPDKVIEVKITLAAADWARLRSGPEITPIPRTTCRGAATGEAYPTFHANLTIEGVSLTDVAIHKKGGLGSIDSARPGLKIDVQEFVPDQRVFGLKHLTLNNNHQDDSRVRQCLAYGLFAKAGLPASRCNFAHVTVNGEDLGVYSNVETIKGNYLRRNFGEDSGRVYESGGDFLSAAYDGFQPKTSPTDCSDLAAISTALEAPNAELETRLGAVVDLPEVTRYLAMEVLTGHWDGYANNRNNFYMYHRASTNKIELLPWGVDATFDDRPRTTRPQSVYACGALAWKLYDAPSTRATYLASLRDLLDNVWRPDALLAEIERMRVLIAPFEKPDLSQRIQPVRDFIMGRAATLRTELAAGDPVWPYPQGEQSCLIDIGSLDLTFSAPWNRLDQYDVGSGTISGTVSGVNLASAAVKASSGLGTDGKVSFHSISPIGGGKYAVVFFSIAPAMYTVGAHPIDFSNVFALLTFYDPATDTATGGGLMLPGTLTLTSTTTTTGTAVTGRLVGRIREL